MLWKMIDCLESNLESSQENVYHGVYFRRVANLQCTYCNSTISGIYHRFLLEYVPKTSCLKKYLEKKNYGVQAF